LETVPELVYVASQLVEDNSYVFRVSAVNEYGASEPVELLKPVTATSSIGKFSQ